jgi:methylmalonyl-CoA/ethylmalonyl-CoA epimerase
MPSVTRIDHVAIVVDDIEHALHFWRDALGLDVTHVEDVAGQDAIVAFLPMGGCEVELVKPTSDKTGVARFLGRRGPGIHHICLEVDDIEASLKKLAQHSIRLVDRKPVIGSGGKRIAFIHPESTHGVLVELYEPTEQEPVIRLARARELADRAMVQGQAVAAGILTFLRALRSSAETTRGDDAEQP